MHLNKSISYFVVLLVLSLLTSVSIEIANAGHTASHSLQPMHLSSPLGYFLKACKPLNLDDSGVFSSGYWIVIGFLDNFRPVILSPFSISRKNKLFINLIILFIIIMVNIQDILVYL